MLLSKAILAGLSISTSNAAPTANQSRMYDMVDITPSADVNWVSCYDKFDCMRLSVPLDYGDPSAGSAALSFIRYRATQQPAKANILVNPGGPAGSGVDYVMATAESTLVPIVGNEYNLIGWDPRGVNLSEPRLVLYEDDAQADAYVAAELKLQLADSSSTSLGRLYNYVNSYGELITKKFGGSTGVGKYASTRATAQDMKTYIEAEARAAGESEEEAKLWYWGGSYGTIIGQTFASYFPDRIERMVLDSVAGFDLYYQNDLSGEFIDADDVMQSFFDNCHRVGPEVCLMYRDTPAKIETAVLAVIDGLKQNPIPVSNTSIVYVPTIATYEMLLQYIQASLLGPYQSFPTMAAVLADLEAGRGESLIKGSGLAGLPNPKLPQKFNPNTASFVITCVDGQSAPRMSSVDAFRHHAQMMVSKSRYHGAVKASTGIMCQNVNIEAPLAGRVTTADLPLGATPAYGIFFMSNTYDPVSPIRNVQIGMEKFPGSYSFEAKQVGHGVLKIPNECYRSAVRQYLNGTEMPRETVCDAEVLPFDPLA